MKISIFFFLLYFVTALIADAQRTQRYYVPTHYHGVFYDQRSSIRAQSLGFNTITLNGVAHSIYNPASIGPGDYKVDLHINYINGHAFELNSHYPFIGAAYKVNPKIAVGVSYFTWITTNDVWTTQVGAKDFDRNGRRSQSMATLNGSYQVIPDLHVGVAGHFLREEGVRGTTTNTDMIYSLGAVYDLDIVLIKYDKINHQSIRVAGSFVNLLLNNRTEQKLEDRINFRSLPIIFRIGAAYSFSIPAGARFIEGKRFFETSDPQIGFQIHLHHQNSLDGSDPVSKVNEDGFGVGVETTFFQRLILRLGYYSETRAENDENSVNSFWATSPKKSGFTSGIGANIPLKELSAGKLPFDAEMHLTFNKIMNELDSSRGHPAGFSNDIRQLGIGLNLIWK